jgi:hypothetical protein
MNTITATTCTVRRANLSDTDFLMRAQTASQYELDSMDRDEIAFGLSSRRLEAYLLITPDTRMCLVVQREGYRALLAAFYREGPRNGRMLKEQAAALWDKVVDELQRGGVTEVACFVHRKNPKRDKLMRFYHRMFGLSWDMVRVGRSI